MTTTVNHPREGQSAQVPAVAFSVNEFCVAHRISRALFYLLQRDGSGPRLMRVGRRTLVTVDAAADWRRRMEAAQGLDGARQ
jgi:hypothetical protein